MRYDRLNFLKWMRDERGIDLREALMDQGTRDYLRTAKDAKDSAVRKWLADERLIELPVEVPPPVPIAPVAPVAPPVIPPAPAAPAAPPVQAPNPNNMPALGQELLDMFRNPRNIMTKAMPRIMADDVVRDMMTGIMEN